MSRGAGRVGLHSCEEGCAKRGSLGKPHGVASRCQGPQTGFAGISHSTISDIQNDIVVENSLVRVARLCPEHRGLRNEEHEDRGELHCFDVEWIYQIWQGRWGTRRKFPFGSICRSMEAAFRHPVALQSSFCSPDAPAAFIHGSGARRHLAVDISAVA